MRILKNACSVLLALLMIVCCAASIYAAETYITLYGLSFDVNEDGFAVIHSYDDRTTELRIPNTLLGYTVGEIADYACFGDTSLTLISLDRAAGLRRIGDSAFSGCTGVASITIPSGVETLGFGTFQNCTALSELTLGDGITAIPAQCFYGCTSLDEVTIPAGVGAIGDYAFAQCTGLKAVTILPQTNEISDTAFDGVKKLTVHCAHDSYADSWAEEHWYKRVYLDGFIRGDADCDGDVSILDATVVQRWLVNYTIEHFSEVYADADSDGKITIFDATAIQRWLAGLDTAPDIGCFIPA